MFWQELIWFGYRHLSSRLIFFRFLFLDYHKRCFEPSVLCGLLHGYELLFTAKVFTTKYNLTALVGHLLEHLLNVVLVNFIQLGFRVSLHQNSGQVLTEKNFCGQLSDVIPWIGDLIGILKA